MSNNENMVRVGGGTRIPPLYWGGRGGVFLCPLPPTPSSSLRPSPEMPRQRHCQEGGSALSDHNAPHRHYSPGRSVHQNISDDVAPVAPRRPPRCAARAPARVAAVGTQRSTRSRGLRTGEVGWDVQIQGGSWPSFSLKFPGQPLPRVAPFPGGRRARGRGAYRTRAALRRPPPATAN